MPRTQPNRSEIPALIAALQAGTATELQRRAAAFQLGFCKFVSQIGASRKVELSRLSTLMQKLRAGTITAQDVTDIIAKLTARAQEP